MAGLPRLRQSNCELGAHSGPLAHVPTFEGHPGRGLCHVHWLIPNTRAVIRNRLYKVGACFKELSLHRLNAILRTGNLSSQLQRTW